MLKGRLYTGAEDWTMMLWQCTNAASGAGAMTTTDETFARATLGAAAVDPCMHDAPRSVAALRQWRSRR